MLIKHMTELARNSPTKENVLFYQFWFGIDKNYSK